MLKCLDPFINDGVFDLRERKICVSFYRFHIHLESCEFLIALFLESRFNIVKMGSHRLLDLLKMVLGNLIPFLGNSYIKSLEVNRTANGLSLLVGQTAL